MKQEISFQVGGVPEHFNLPWHLAIEAGKFAEKGIDVQWTDYGGGTGAMMKDLREKNIDIAVILTEGIVADITKGNDCKIVQFYVNSPLRWGIHVAADSPYQSVADLQGTKTAISRFGSGSHLMSYVNADQEGWDLKKLSFEVVKNLDGGRKALSTGEADYFLWEKFTTKPFVDNGEFRSIGECPTPWPPFVIAVRNDILLCHFEKVKALLDTINASCKAFMQHENAVQLVAQRYQLKEEDVKLWFAETEWTCHSRLDQEHINKVQERLIDLEIINRKASFPELCVEMETDLVNY